MHHSDNKFAATAKTIMTDKTIAMPRPSVDSGHHNGLNCHNGLICRSYLLVAGRDVASVGISEEYKQR